MGLFQEIRLTLSSGGDGAQRRVAWRLAVVGAAVLSFSFGLHHLITNEDTRFAVLARDALVNGHWLTPALPDGTPHLMKPPLQAWLIALASWWTRSVTVRTAVLPSVLGAIGVVLVTFWLGRRLFGPDAGLVAGLTVATSLGIYQMAHSSMRPVWSGEEAPRGQGPARVGTLTDSGPPRNPRHVNDASVSHHGYVVRAEVTAYSIHRP